jgi:hypothetical protein
MILLKKTTSPMAVMAPVAVVPVMTVPAVVTPVTMVPVAVMPAHLHGLHLIDFILRHDRRLNVDNSRHGRRLARDRRYGSSLCACGKQDRACDQSSTEIQETRKFHDVMPLPKVREIERVQSHRPNMNVR